MFSGFGCFGLQKERVCMSFPELTEFRMFFGDSLFEPYVSSEYFFGNGGAFQVFCC